jgi:hypothetical protein
MGHTSAHAGARQRSAMCRSRCSSSSAALYTRSPCGPPSSPRPPSSRCGALYRPPGPLHPFSTPLRNPLRRTRLQRAGAMAGLWSPFRARRGRALRVRSDCCLSLQPDILSTHSHTRFEIASTRRTDVCIPLWACVGTPRAHAGARRCTCVQRKRSARSHAGEAAPTITNVTGWLQEGCATRLTGRQLYERQSLFTIYVHRGPATPDPRHDSIFAGRDIASRCALWGA